MRTEGGPGGEELPVVQDVADSVTVARRWAADPLPLLAVVGVVGLVWSGSAAQGSVADGSTGLLWLVPALFGVVTAGLALSGST